MNNEAAISWISTDGFSVTVDTDETSMFTTQDYRVKQYYWLEGTSIFDEFKFSITAPSSPLCVLTSLTTDDVISNTIIYYLEGSGLQNYPMDTIISQTPACNYSTFTIFVMEDSRGDVSSQGIIVDSSTSPPTLKVNSIIAAPVTYNMRWYADPGTTCLNAISFPFIIKIYCELTSASVDVSTYLDNSYDLYVDTAGSITYPSFL
jgi:hypothetical protein